MENINLVLQNYLLLVIIVLLALVIMLYVMYKGQKKELQALKEKYDFFTQGDNVNWDELIIFPKKKKRYCRKILL